MNRIRIRIGNDFLVAWRIKRAGVSEDLSQAVNMSLVANVKSGGEFHSAIVPFEIIDNSIVRIEITPLIAQWIGIYNFVFKYEFEYPSYLDNNEKCTVDKNIFSIVGMTTQADDITLIECESDVLIGLKGEKGDSAFTVWNLENGGENTYQDWIDFLQAPATDAAGLADAATSRANGAADLAIEKAGDANDAAGLAIEKAGLAGSAATLANNKAGLANDAAILANAKAELANTKAGEANTQAIYAEAQGDYAKAQGEIAETAAATANAAKGWTPIFVDVSDGARIVRKLESYIGGTGTAPTLNVGKYLKLDGTYTSVIADAVNYKGVAGEVSNAILINTEEALANVLNTMRGEIASLKQVIAQGVLTKVQIGEADIQKLKYQGSEMTLSGVGVPSVIPDFIGQRYVQVGVKVWESVGISSVADWK